MHRTVLQTFAVLFGGDGWEWRHRGRVPTIVDRYECMNVRISEFACSFLVVRAQTIPMPYHMRNLDPYFHHPPFLP